MLLDIECTNDSAYNCNQIAIATIANFYNRNSQMMAIGKWCFQYETEADDIIGNKIQPYYRRDIVGYSFFNGIDVNIYEVNYRNTREEFIKLLQENKPIIIHSDAFTCRWNVAYGKYHILHFYIIYGYLEESDIFICMDPYLNQKYIESTYLEIYDGMTDYRVITLKEEKIDEYIFKTELQNDVKFYKEESTFQKINQFANEIEKCMNLDEEIKGFEKDLYAVPLLDNLKIINANRKGYIKMLEYINNITNLHLDDIIDKAMTCTMNWEFIRILLIKTFVTKNKSILERVVIQIKNVNQVEQQMFQMLSDYCSIL
jgi:hypothetical protein